MATSDARAEWKRAGLHLAIWLFGTGLGILLVVPMLALLGTIIRLPLIGDFVGDFLWFVTKDHDMPIFGAFVVVCWILGLGATYTIVALMLKRRARARS